MCHVRIRSVDFAAHLLFMKKNPFEAVPLPRPFRFRNARGWFPSLSFHWALRMLALVCLTATPVVGLENANDDLPSRAEALILKNPDDLSETRRYVSALTQIHFEVLGVMFSSQSPMIDKYMAVGQRNVPVLVEFIGSDAPHPFFIQIAIERLATVDDKEAILRGFREHVGLIDLIIKFGWEKEARETLLQHLRETEYSTLSQVVQGVANLEDPTTYSVLKAYLERCANPGETYRIIRDLPGIEVGPSLKVVWERLKDDANGRRGRQYFAPILAEDGHLGALTYLFVLLRDKAVGAPEVEGVTPGFAPAAIKARILRITDAPFEYEVEELAAWFDQNSERIHFDAKASRWITLEERKHRTWTDLDGREVLATMLKGSESDVTIEREAGRVFLLSLDRVSAEDREYVRRQNLAPTDD